jgi:hypothetical protein
MEMDEMEMEMGGEGGMKAAMELDAEEDDALSSASPSVTVKARTISALVQALNKVMPLFSAPKIEVEITDLKEEPMPLDLMKALQMLNAAYSDYADEELVSIPSMADDKGALIEVSKIMKVLGDKGFAKYLKKEVMAPKVEKESLAPEMESEDEDEKMMMRMGMA